jgi:hypothetical protein
LICADLYEAPAVLEDKDDVVVTSYGAITWLPETGYGREYLQGVYNKESSSRRPGDRRAGLRVGL